MAKIIEKTKEKTTYQLSTKNKTLTLKNEPFEKSINNEIISRDNPKIKNQLSIF